MIAVLLFLAYGLACKGENKEPLKRVQACPLSRAGGNLTHYVEQLMKNVSSLVGRQPYETVHQIISDIKFHVPPKVHGCIYQGYNEGSREHTFSCLMTFPLTSLKFTIKMRKVVDEDDVKIMLRNYPEETIPNVNASALITVKNVISGFRSVEVKGLDFHGLGGRIKKKMLSEKPDAVTAWRLWAVSQSDIFANEAFAQSYYLKCIFYFDDISPGP